MSEEITLKEVLNGKEGVRINLKQVKDYAQKCKNDKNNQICRRIMQDLGIDIIE